MKKTLLFSVSIILLLSCVTALADPMDFSLRDGIMFGQTVDEVTLIEKKNGTVLQLVDNDTEFDITTSLFKNLYGSNGIVEEGPEYKTGELSIIGFNGSIIKYGFFNNGKLSSIKYIITSGGWFNNDGPLLDDAFNLVEQGLVKYDKNLLTIPQTLARRSVYNEWYDEMEESLSSDRDTSLHGRSERLVEIDDGYVLIEHFAFVISTVSVHRVYYSYISPEELSTVLENENMILQEFQQNLKDNF